MKFQKVEWLAWVLCSGVVGCGSSGGFDPGPGPWDDGAVIPHEPQVLGDPTAGFEALVTNGYVSCGIPLSIFPAAQLLLGDIANTPPLTDSAGQPLRQGKNADIPYNWNVHESAEGVDIVSPNCLTCHAGEFNGEFIIGLGNVTSDYTELPGGEDVDAILDAFDPNLIEGGHELKELLERQQAIGHQSTQATVGTNPAIAIGIALASHRDARTLAWLEEPHTPLWEVRLPADVPPWWRTKKKSSHFYNGMSRGDHRGTMMFASMLCIDSVEEAAEIVDYFDDVHAYIQSIEPPAYPFDIDQALADRGEELFLDNCAGCHGTYGSSDAADTYPNLIIPTNVIETDATYAEGASAFEGLRDWFSETFYAESSRIVLEGPFLGYTAPPLDAIWATAPFLHNGSVPTIEAVLDPTQRPVYWKRVDYNSTHFDKDALGWPYETLSYGQSEASDEERRLIYDTTIIGHGNSGHTFGEHLRDVERRAVIEYLKTL